MNYCTLNIVVVRNRNIECIKKRGFCYGNIFVYRVSNYIHSVYDKRTGQALGSVVTTYPIDLDELECKLVVGFLSLTRDIVPLRDFLLKKFVDMKMQDVSEKTLVFFSVEEFEQFLLENQP